LLEKFKKQGLEEVKTMQSFSTERKYKMHRCRHFELLCNRHFTADATMQ